MLGIIFRSIDKDENESIGISREITKPEVMLRYHITACPYQGILLDRHGVIRLRDYFNSVLEYNERK